jgi:hypothetical protein
VLCRLKALCRVENEVIVWSIGVFVAFRIGGCMVVEGQELRLD